MVLILIITLCLCAFLNFVGVRSYVLLDTYSGFADHFTTIGVIFIVFWTTVVGLALRLFHPLLRLSAAHLALIYAALMVATVIPTMGFGGYVIPLLAGVFYYATPENNWKYLIWDHIPEWVVPRDLQAITGLFQGIPADQPIPWGLWIKPLFLWGTFMLAFYLVSVSFITLMHHQWSRRERLVYPMTILPTSMVESLDDPAGSIFRSKLLWVGFLIAWSIPTIDVLDRLFDFQVLDGFEIPVANVLVSRSLGLSYRIEVNPLIIGLGYLVNLNVLLGVWGCHVLMNLEDSLLVWAGIVSPLPAGPLPSGSVLMTHQQIGALFFLVLSSLWVSRDYLRQQWCLIVRGGIQEPYLLSPRCVAFVGLVGLLYMAGFLYATGLSLLWSLGFLLVALLVFFGMARLVAQTGLGRMRAPYSLPPILTNILGTGHLSDRDLTAMGVNFVWASDLQLFFMATLAHAFKVCEEAKQKITSRQLFLFMTDALIVSLVTALGCYIWLGYRHGLIHGWIWYFVMSPDFHWSWVANTMNNPHPPQLQTAFFMGLGAALAALLTFANHHIAGWPLHPAGLVLGMTQNIRFDWFSIFLAWLLKAAILRYGGASLFRQARPFFIGLLLGASVGIGGASLAVSFFYA